MIQQFPPILKLRVFQYFVYSHKEYSSFQQSCQYVHHLLSSKDGNVLNHNPLHIFPSWCIRPRSLRLIHFLRRPYSDVPSCNQNGEALLRGSQVLVLSYQFRLRLVEILVSGEHGMEHHNKELCPVPTHWGTSLSCRH